MPWEGKGGHVGVAAVVDHHFPAGPRGQTHPEEATIDVVYPSIGFNPGTEMLAVTPGLALVRAEA